MKKRSTYVAISCSVRYDGYGKIYNLLGRVIWIQNERETYFRKKNVLVGNNFESIGCYILVTLVTYAGLPWSDSLAQKLSDNCLTTTWRLLDNCLTTAWWLPDDCLTTAQWLPDYCPTNAWRLPVDYRTTPWWLPDDCPTIAWQLPDNYFVTEYQFSGN